MESWMENAIVCAMNTIFVMNVIFVLQILFGVNLCKNISRYVIIGVLFMGADFAVEMFLDSDTNIEFFGICSYFVLCAILLSKEHRIRSVLFIIPAILLNIQWGKILSLIDQLFCLDRYSITLDGQRYAPFDLFSDIIIFIILIAVLSYCAKKSKRIQVTIGEGIFFTFFCFFSTMIVSIFEMLESGFHNRAYSVTWISFVIMLNVAILYGVLYRNHAKYYKSLSENFKEQFVYFTDIPMTVGFSLKTKAAINNGKEYESILSRCFYL